MANEPRPLTGLAAGIAAGLIATAAAAALAPRVIDQPPGSDDASASNARARLIVGAVIGGVYGLIAEYRADASDGFDAALGTATAALFEDRLLADPDVTPPPATPFAAILAGLRRLITGSQG